MFLEVVTALVAGITVSFVQLVMDIRAVNSTVLMAVYIFRGHNPSVHSNKGTMLMTAV